MVGQLQSSPLCNPWVTAYKAEERRDGELAGSADGQPWTESSRGAGSLPASGLYVSPLEPPSWGDLSESRKRGWSMGCWEHAGVGPAALGTAVGGRHGGTMRKTFHNFISRKR